LGPHIGRRVRQTDIGRHGSASTRRRALRGCGANPYNRRMNGRQADVLVLGGGAIGLACARVLLEAGRSVTVLDQGRVGGGSSHGNCGTLTPSHAMPLAQPGMVATALRWLLKPDAPLRIAPRVDP